MLNDDKLFSFFQWLYLFYTVSKAIRQENINFDSCDLQKMMEKSWVKFYRVQGNPIKIVLVEVCKQRFKSKEGCWIEVGTEAPDGDA